MKSMKNLAIFAALAAMAVSAAAAFDPSVATAITHALQTPEGLMLAVFAPTAVTKAIGGAYERKDAAGDDDSGPAIVEIKRLLEDQGKAWKTYRDTNDALLKAKADGKAVGDLEAKLEKITDDLDAIAEAVPSGPVHS